MTSCPHCEARLETPLPAICPSCGESLGQFPRKKAEPAGTLVTIEPERVLFEGHPAALSGLFEITLTVLTLGIAGLAFWLRSLALHYKITNHRIVIEEGLFGKRIEQVDLYRVEDYVVEIPFSQRIAGTGNLAIATSDRSTRGGLRLERIRTDVRQLYEQLRHATERDKAARGVRRIDSV